MRHLYKNRKNARICTFAGMKKLILLSTCNESMKKSKSSLLLLLLLYAFVLCGCSGWFSPLRYPDLRRVERENVNPFTRTMAEKVVKPLSAIDTSRVQKIPLVPVLKEPLAMFTDRDAGIKSVPAGKIIIRHILKYKGVPLMKKMRKMTGQGQTPPYGLIIFLIVLMSICLAYGILILILATTTQPGCLIPLFAIAAVCGILIIILLKQ